MNSLKRPRGNVFSLESVSHSYWLIIIPSLGRSSLEAGPCHMAVSTDGRIQWCLYSKEFLWLPGSRSGSSKRDQSWLVGIALAGTAKSVTLTSILFFLTTHSTPHLAIHSTNTWLQISGHEWIRERTCSLLWSYSYGFTWAWRKSKCHLKMWLWHKNYLRLKTINKI